MTESVHPVAASDALVSALSERRRVDDGDPLLRSLQAWVQRIDGHPMAPWTRPLPPIAKTASRAELGRRVAALTVALTLSSSGLATAVTGDPLSPLHFVKREYNHLRQSDHRAPRWPDGRGMPAEERDSAPGVSRSLTRPVRRATPRPRSHVVRRSWSP